jgi:hypothetical protein
MSVRAVVLLLSLSAAIGASEATLAWLTGRVSHDHRTPATQVPDSARKRHIEVSVPDRDGASRRRDLRGNDIVRPVAKYRLDRRGTLYEVHSPGTQVPRLGAPQL